MPQFWPSSIKQINPSRIVSPQARQIGFRYQVASNQRIKISHRSFPVLRFSLTGASVGQTGRIVCGAVGESSLLNVIFHL